MKNKKGAIYYTDFHADEKILKTCQEQLKKSFDGDIVSVTLGKQLDLGKNIVHHGQRSYPSMVRQIIIALENLGTKYVFFTEHDVLYPPQHFDFTPPRDDIFYYNKNVWRWYYKTDKVIKWKRMLPLSCLCVNRELALKNYRIREMKIKELGIDATKSSECYDIRKMGYEPGTKQKRRGGLTNDDFDTWSSGQPVIDIRHNKTFSPPKINLTDFKHPPVDWQEKNISELPEWDLKKIFEL